MIRLRHLALLLSLLAAAAILPGCAEDPVDLQVYDPAGLIPEHVPLVIEAAAFVNAETGSHLRIEAGGASGFRYVSMNNNWGVFECSYKSCLITYDLLLLDPFYSYIYSKVFSHELGHAAGLEHNCPDNNSFKELGEC